MVRDEAIVAMTKTITQPTTTREACAHNASDPFSLVAYFSISGFDHL